MKLALCRIAALLAVTGGIVGAPLLLTATPANAATQTYTVDAPAPDAGAGCTRHFTIGFDSDKPQPVILRVLVSC